MGFFRYQQIVGGRRFVGRETTLRALLAGVGHQRSFALFGGPGCGKSSLLNETMHRIERQQHQSKAALVAVPADLSAYNADARGATGFVQDLWQKLMNAVANNKARGSDVLPQPPKFDVRNHDDPWKIFADACAGYWEELAGTRMWCEYVLLLDGGDALGALESVAFSKALCDLEEIDEPWAPQAIIIAGGRSFYEFVSYDETPLPFLRPLYLGALNLAEATRLLQEGIPHIDESTIAEVCTQSGKHPLLVQRLGANLEQHIDTINHGDMQLAIDRASDCTVPLFERLWEEFDLGRSTVYRGAYAAPVHALMQLLIDTQTGCDIKFAEQELHIKPLKEYAQFLEFSGIAQRVVTANTVIFQAQCHLWNRWYTERMMR